MTTPRSRAIYAAQGAYSLFIRRAYVAEGFEAEPVEAAPRRAPALPVSIMPRAKPRALWSFPASRVADAIDGATDWLCSAEFFGFDGSEALAFN